jgi:hypothetical protein
MGGPGGGEGVDGGPCPVARASEATPGGGVSPMEMVVGFVAAVPGVASLARATKDVGIPPA